MAVYKGVAAGAGQAGASETTVVRRGGALELRVRGTFASYYKPGSALTGSVWDALAAPLLRARARAPRAVGAAPRPRRRERRARRARARARRAHRRRRDRPPPSSPSRAATSSSIALGVEVVQADARVFLARSRERFDAVLDDVFVGRGRAVRKPAWLLEGGLAAAASRVAPGGLLASNALDEAADVARHLAARFPRVLAIDVAGYDNRVLVGGPPRLAARALRAAVARSPVLSPTLPDPQLPHPCAPPSRALRPPRLPRLRPVRGSGGVGEELEDGAVEALGGLGHHEVGADLEGHEPRARDLVGELAVELRRRELVVAPAEDEGRRVDAAQTVGRVVGEARLALAHEEVVEIGSAPSPREAPRHRLDEIALLEGLVLQRPEQPLADEHLRRRVRARHLAPLLEQEPALRVGPRVAADEHEPRRAERVPQRELLRDHPAEEDAEHVGAPDAEASSRPARSSARSAVVKGPPGSSLSPTPRWS